MPEKLEKKSIRSNFGPYIPGEKRHINIIFLLWLTSRWPWDKRLVAPGLTGPKSLCVHLETQENKHFLQVNRRVVPGLSGLSKSLCVQSLCAFFLPYICVFYSRPICWQVEESSPQISHQFFPSELSSKGSHEQSRSCVVKAICWQRYSRKWGDKLHQENPSHDNRHK